MAMYTFIIFYIFIISASSAFNRVIAKRGDGGGNNRGSNASSRSKGTVILVDPFSDYLSGFCREYCENRGIRLIECISPYMAGYFLSKGSEVPQHLLSPVEGKELEWAKEKGIYMNKPKKCRRKKKDIVDIDNEIEGDEDENDADIVHIDSVSDDADDDDDAADDHNDSNIDDDQNDDGEIICVLSESDSGVSTAEKIQSGLGLPMGNGISPSLRNKFLMNENAKERGLKTVKQALVKSWDAAVEFIEEIWSNRNDDIDTTYDDKKNLKSVVVKPYRGVASDGVYMASSLVEAEKAFYSLIGKPKYGGGVNDAVLIQEYADGPEYAVDTVAMDGEIKVVALWRYRKLPANGAPFVYQCSELVDVATQMEQRVCDYCIAVLQAQNLRWGPTHTEIKYTKDGPRLIEINARWHAQHFYPIVKACLGYDAITSTLDAYFDRKAFNLLPKYPISKKSAGLILHLISNQEGKVKEIKYIDEIQRLRSTLLVDMDIEVGGDVVRTVDIRTDCGYVLLCHHDPEVVAGDYDHIVSLQSTMIEVEPTSLPPPPTLGDASTAVSNALGIDVDEEYVDYEVDEDEAYDYSSTTIQGYDGSDALKYSSSIAESFNTNAAIRMIRGVMSNKLVKLMLQTSIMGVASYITLALSLIVMQVFDIGMIA